MSGGSFNYLYNKEPQELMEYYNIARLQEMADILSMLGYDDIARDMQRLVEYLKTAYNRIDVLSGQLSDVMHAIEWERSGDYGRDNLIKHLEDYRNSKEQKNAAKKFKG